MKTLLIVCLATASLFAQNQRKPIFISAAELDMSAVLATPPANDSDRTKAELAELHRLQDTRSAAESAQAKWDDEHEDMFVFANILGEAFAKDKLPATALLAAHLRNDEGQISNQPKSRFARVRPYNLDKTLKPICAVKTIADSFPSGHSTSGYLAGITLALMLPEKRDAILARADDYAHNRLVCGVHYPSDIAASKLVAYSAMAIIEQKSQFKEELAAARKETRAALGLRD